MTITQNTRSTGRSGNRRVFGEQSSVEVRLWNEPAFHGSEGGRSPKEFWGILYVDAQNTHSMAQSMSSYKKS